MKLLIDMNLSPRWVAVLNDGGLQAVHWLLAGRGSHNEKVSWLQRAIPVIHFVPNWTSGKLGCIADCVATSFVE